MTGQMVRVTPPNDSSEGLDGFANLDTQAMYASIGLGGDYVGTANVIVDGIPTAFGDSVEVRVEYVPWSNKDTAVEGPVTLAQLTQPVEDGRISVAVDMSNRLYGYRVYLAPIGQLE
jgi:hypothetical protein